MQTQELRTLKILEAVEQEDAPSQRDLARHLNVSLGLVNSFIKRLAAKGYFKVTTIPRNRVRYILTPKGAAEKTRLTYEFIQFSYQFYKQSREKLREEFKALEKRGVHSVVFYGAGEFAEIAYATLQETTIELAGIVDDHKQGKRFFGKTIASPQVLRNGDDFDMLLITAVTSGGKVREKILKMGIPEDKIASIQ